MKYAMVAAFAAGAMAGVYPGMEAPSNGTDTYVTEVVTAFTTYCPSATQITHGGSTYTVTEATTLTITNCPCTVTKPVTTSTTSVCSTCSETSAAPVYSSSSESEVSTSAAPVYTTSAPVTPPVSGVPTSYAANSTVPVYSSPSASTSAGAYSTFTGAANHVNGQAGAGLAALLGFAAYVL